MTRDELEALIWRHWPTRGGRSAQAVNAILCAADTYVVDGEPDVRYTRCTLPHGRRAYRHTSGTDLHPVISVLAQALLGDEASAPEWDGQPSYEVRREYLDSFGGVA